MDPCFHLHRREMHRRRRGRGRTYTGCEAASNPPIVRPPSRGAMGGESEVGERERGAT